MIFADSGELIKQPVDSTSEEIRDAKVCAKENSEEKNTSDDLIKTHSDNSENNNSEDLANNIKEEE